MNIRLYDYLVRRIDTRASYEDLLRFPRYFEIETVNGCNARCPICTVDTWERQAGAMKDLIFERIASELIEASREENIIRVSLFRDGEPLLDKKLADRVAYLKQGGIRHVSTTTNGSLLDERRARDLLLAGIDSVSFSIDSNRKEVFEQIRVDLIFEEVQANLLRFISLRDQLRPTTEIKIRMTRQDANRLEWPEFHAFWRSKLTPNDRVYYHDVHNWGGQAMKVALITASKEVERPCVALWSLCVIFANGDVPICNVDYKNSFNNGNVMQQSIREIWHSRQIALWREWHLTSQKGNIPICQTCNAWDEPSDFHKQEESAHV